jgi:hypothetical protein
VLSKRVKVYVRKEGVIGSVRKRVKGWVKKRS